MQEVWCLFPHLQDEASFLAWVESLYSLSPEIAPRGNECTFIRFSGTNPAREHQRTALFRLQVLQKRFSIRYLRRTLGGSPSESYLQAFYPKQSLLEVPLSEFALRAVVDPFHAETSLWADPLSLWVPTLESLGLRKLGDLTHLPPSELIARMGKSAEVLLERLNHPHRVLWPSFTPSEVLSDRLECDSIENLDPLVFGIKTLLDRFSSRLKSRGKRIRSLKLSFDSRSPREPLLLSFPSSQTHPSMMVSILRERLQAELRRFPLKAPIHSIHLLVLETTPARQSQRDLFLSSEQDQTETRLQTLTRISQRVRVGGVQWHSTHRPERAWSLSKPMQKASPPEVFPPRPSLLLPQPIPLREDGVFLLTDSQVWQRTRASAPERIQSEWWKLGFKRDYTRVETTQGVDLWVFREKGTLYLHGFFD